MRARLEFRKGEKFYKIIHIHWTETRGAKILSKELPNGMIWAMCYVGEIAPNKVMPVKADYEWETPREGVSKEKFSEVVDWLAKGFPELFRRVAETVPEIREETQRIQIKDYSHFATLEEQFKAMAEEGILTPVSETVTKAKFQRLVLSGDIELVRKSNSE
jgi:hypothetical protein